jgi:hypothetical protein
MISERRGYCEPQTALDADGTEQRDSTTSEQPRSDYRQIQPASPTRDDCAEQEKLRREIEQLQQMKRVDE